MPYHDVRHTVRAAQFFHGGQRAHSWRIMAGAISARAVHQPRQDRRDGPARWHLRARRPPEHYASSSDTICIPLHFVYGCHRPNRAETLPAGSRCPKFGPGQIWRACALAARCAALSRCRAAGLARKAVIGDLDRQAGMASRSGAAASRPVRRIQAPPVRIPLRRAAPGARTNGWPRTERTTPTILRPAEEPPAAPAAKDRSRPARDRLALVLAWIVGILYPHRGRHHDHGAGGWPPAWRSSTSRGWCPALRGGSPCIRPFRSRPFRCGRRPALGGLGSSRASSR